MSTHDEHKLLTAARMPARLAVDLALCLLLVVVLKLRAQANERWHRARESKAVASDNTTLVCPFINRTKVINRSKELKHLYGATPTQR